MERTRPNIEIIDGFPLLVIPLSNYLKYQNIIQVLYTGTVDEELLHEENLKTLTDQIMDSLPNRINHSKYIFQQFNQAPNPNLPEGKVFFNCLIDLLPDEEKLQPIAAESAELKVFSLERKDTPNYEETDAMVVAASSFENALLLAAETVGQSEAHYWNRKNIQYTLIGPYQGDIQNEHCILVSNISA